MARCASCNAEIAATLSACASCGASVNLNTGTLATIAMAEPAATPTSRTSRPSLLDTSIPDEGRFPPGTLVNGRYRIVGLLGRGGMGEVYRATDLTLAQAVALKFLPETGVSERVLERFHAEVRIARQISHPNICRVYDIGEVEGQPFISMEYVDGEDLADLLQRIGRLPSDKALETARKICAGLAAAHDKGVIHRDLKPQNIMLNKRGEPVIMDFGLAAVADQLTGAEARNGTPAYMSPEQLRGDEVTAKSDIYALGLVLYEIFSGKRAYEAQTIGDLLKLQEGGQVTSLTSLASDVDPQVEKVIKRCLNPNAALRPATALAVAAALPGGDPLAAALAAGETPSPELVAASGSTEGMDLRYSVPLLVFVFAVLIGVPLRGISAGSLQKIPDAFGPAVAGHEARKIASSLGYTKAPVDTLVQGGSTGQREYWKSHDRKGRSWDELIAAEPFYYYYYRESPAPLAAWPFGYASSDYPAPTTTGMLAVTMTFNGHLRQLDVVPPEKVEQAAAGMDEAALFKTLGFDRSRFEEAGPQWVPVVNSDFRKAWKGSSEGSPDVEVRIEAASLAGKLTSVRVFFPWDQADRDPPKPETGGAFAGPLIYDLLKLLAGIAALILVWRNIKLNRGDRRGAFRLAAAGFAGDFVHWIGSAHHVAGLMEWEFFVNAMGDSLFSAISLWVLYMALEPAVRSRWPHTLVTWNRLLTGRFGDAQLGSHILVGAAVGFTLFLGLLAHDWLELAHRQSGAPAYANLNASWDTLSWIGDKGQVLYNALRFGLLTFFCLFLFRLMVKNDYLAALVTAVTFAAIENQGIWARNWIETLVLLGIFMVLSFVLLRMGVVTAMVAIVFVNSLGRITLGPGLSGWYSGYGLAAMALLGAIALYGFWRSIGARQLSDEGA